MSAVELLDWVHATPFRPFRLMLNSQRSFTITHPEMIRVGHTTAYIFSYPKDLSGPHERVEMIGLQLVEHVEAADVGTPAPGNGAGM